MLMISDAVWNEIKKNIPGKKSKVGRPENDAHKTLSGIYYIMLTGAQWRCLPDYYGKPSTVHGRFMTWMRSGVFKQIFLHSIDCAINVLGEPEAFISDTTSTKAPLAKFGGKNPT